MMRPWLLLLVGSAALLVAAQDEYSYEYGYDYGYGYDGLYAYDGFYDYVEDPYGYYEDDADMYYEEYGYYADDDFFYNEYYDEYYDYHYDYEQIKDCTIGKEGKVVLANGTAPCDIKIEGVDEQADLLKGGLDGVYKLYSCYDGRPAYKRQNSPAGEDRVLFYSHGYGDWDISKGASPAENDILMYGGDMEHHAVPLFVKSWHVGADLVSGSNVGEDYYVPTYSATLKCADGKVYEAPKVNPVLQKQGPILTDEEIEAKYRLIYDTYGRRPEPNPTVNFSFVVMLVMIGLTIVLAIPYLLVSKQRNGKGYQPVATSFAQVIQQSKKKSSGHLH